MNINKTKTIRRLDNALGWISLIALILVAGCSIKVEGDKRTSKINDNKSDTQIEVIEIKIK